MRFRTECSFRKSHCHQQGLRCSEASSDRKTALPKFIKEETVQRFSEQELLIGGIQKQEGGIIKQYRNPIMFFLGLLLGIKNFFHLIVIVKNLANLHDTDNLIWISRILSNIAPFSNTQTHTNKCILLFR